MRQEGVGQHRRWFEDEQLELIVWYEAAAVSGFQICYVANDRRERALTWQQGRGFSHSVVESGDTRPDKNMTPILVPDGAVPWGWVEREFAARNLELDAMVREFVLGKLKEHPRNGS